MVVLLPRFSSQSSLAFSSGLMAGSMGQIMTEFAAKAGESRVELSSSNRARSGFMIISLFSITSPAQGDGQRVGINAGARSAGQL